MGQQESKKKAPAAQSSHPDDPGIILVKEKPELQDLDEFTRRLQQIPQFQPIIPETSNSTFFAPKSNSGLLQFNSAPLLSACSQNQKLLESAGSGISYEQKALTVKVKEVRLSLQCVRCTCVSECFCVPIPKPRDGSARSDGPDSPQFPSSNSR